MFPRNENRNEGTFGCSPRTKNRNEGTFACSPGTKTWAVIWGGAKRMGGGKRTRECGLPKIFGPVQKSFWSALSWIKKKKNRALTPEGGWKTYRTRGGPKPIFGTGVIREVFHPPLFSTSPWRRLKNRNEGTFAKTTLLRNCPFISQ